MSRGRLLWITGGLTVGLFAALTVVDGAIRSSGGPGIVSFELAGSTERVTVILGHWGESGRDAAALSLWLDFLFLLAYGSFLCLAVLAVRDAARERGFAALARPGTLFAALPLAAAGFDILENAGLLWMVAGKGIGTGPPIVTAFAVAKFVLLAITIGYLLVGLFTLVRFRLRQADREAVG